MAGVFGLRNIAMAAGVDPSEVVALLRAGGDTRWLLGRVLANAERRSLEEWQSGERPAAAAKEPDMSEFLASCEISE